MFKITQQLTDSGELSNLYTLVCYSYSENSRSNIQAWSVSNLSEIDLAKMLQGRSNSESGDADFAFVVLKSGNGPAILTGQGDLMTLPVKQEIPIRSYNGTREAVFQRKKRRNISH